MELGECQHAYVMVSRPSFRHSHRKSRFSHKPSEARQLPHMGYKEIAAGTVAEGGGASGPSNALVVLDVMEEGGPVDGAAGAIVAAVQAQNSPREIDEGIDPASFENQEERFLRAGELAQEAEVLKQRQQWMECLQKYKQVRPNLLIFQACVKGRHLIDVPLISAGKGLYPMLHVGYLHALRHSMCVLGFRLLTMHDMFTTKGSESSA